MKTKKRAKAGVGLLKEEPASEREQPTLPLIEVAGMEVLSRALRVLEAVHVPRGISDELVVESYSNEREQGFAVARYGEDGIRKLAFAEDRRSDLMVLYDGDGEDFGSGNVPKEGAYVRKRLFRDEAELVSAIEAVLSEKPANSQDSTRVESFVPAVLEESAAPTTEEHCALHRLRTLLCSRQVMAVGDCARGYADGVEALERYLSRIDTTPATAPAWTRGGRHG